MACISHPPFSCSSSSSAPKPSSLSWSASFPKLPISLSVNNCSSASSLSSLNKACMLALLLPAKEFNSFIQAAWTRRSRGEAAKRPSRKSWKQRTDMYMRPFLLDVFFSKRFVHAKVMHRGTSKVISVASTNAKDLRYTLPSLTDDNACKVIGNLIAERSMEADVYAMSFEPKRSKRIEGKLGIVLDTIKENGIIFV
ncbi:hypothetical protein FEM48_Zijuj06G0207400 [Ziziphus jujuba var. spinosa]|uniref:50S ribosomal protein L18 n=1 Tax=Ziziphus jujuba var. spinosa TaxID=714518 RepID=A0A978VBI7_ZIZJJ|nr:hypothetical protein FEM48_Zijuj06G0207400 [Ziziphus jujuba var. spinosa]